MRIYAEITEDHLDPEGKDIKAFGVKIILLKEYNRAEEVICVYPALSLNREKTESFIEKFNSSDVSPIHISDIIEDEFLC